MDSSQHVSAIVEIEAEKQCEGAQIADDRNVLAEAKKLGREAHAAVKAQLAQERAAVSEANKMEKLRLATEQKAEKARLVAESKAKRVDTKVCINSFNSDVFNIFSRQINGKQHYKSSKVSPKVNCMLSHHLPMSPPQSQSMTI
jgi:hypothetical protein